jgi:hypothetical protein
MAHSGSGSDQTVARARMLRGLLGAALTVATLVIADHALGYALLGNGALSCQAWTDARRDPHSPETPLSEQWVVGFLSGIGSMVLGELDPLRGLQAGSVYAWVDNYCGAHPSETIEAAARVFIQQHLR